MIETARSFLFVPGNRPDRFDKAVTSGAHVVIVDLEDAVGADEKLLARRHAVEWFNAGGRGIVRINSVDTVWFADDLAALAMADIGGIMLPKADSYSVKVLSERLDRKLDVVALVETASGLSSLPEFARSGGIRRIAFGHLDFCADLAVPADEAVLDMARFQIALHSRAAGIRSPIDGVSTQISDPPVLNEDIERSRRLGFSAKLCIHPNQVSAVNKGFAPSASEIEWARRVVAAFGQSLGTATQLDGKMIDKPVAARAQAILDDAS